MFFKYVSGGFDKSVLKPVAIQYTLNSSFYCTSRKLFFSEIGIANF